MTEEQVAEVKAAQEKMMSGAQGVFTKMYESMQGAAGAAGAGPDMSGFAGADMGGAADAGANDDIIDGDFKEI